MRDVDHALALIKVAAQSLGQGTPEAFPLLVRPQIRGYPISSTTFRNIYLENKLLDHKRHTLYSTFSGPCQVARPRMRGRAHVAARQRDQEHHAHPSPAHKRDHDPARFVAHSHPAPTDAMVHGTRAAPCVRHHDRRTALHPIGEGPTHAARRAHVPGRCHPSPAAPKSSSRSSPRTSIRYICARSSAPTVASQTSTCP